MSDTIIYKGQTSLKIRVRMGVDITGATSVLIKYEDPQNQEGSFSASVESATLGIIYYNVPSGYSFVQGDWTIWGYVVMSDNRVVIGDPAYFKVAKEGKTK